MISSIGRFDLRQVAIGSVQSRGGRGAVPGSNVMKSPGRTELPERSDLLQSPRLGGRSTARSGLGLWEPLLGAVARDIYGGIA